MTYFKLSAEEIVNSIRELEKSLPKITIEVDLFDKYGNRTDETEVQEVDDNTLSDYIKQLEEERHFAVEKVKEQKQDFKKIHQLLKDGEINKALDLILPNIDYACLIRAMEREDQSEILKFLAK